MVLVKHKAICVPPRASSVVRPSAASLPTPMSFWPRLWESHRPNFIELWIGCNPPGSPHLHTFTERHTDTQVLQAQSVRQASFTTTAPMQLSELPAVTWVAKTTQQIHPMVSTLHWPHTRVTFPDGLLPCMHECECVCMWAGSWTHLEFLECQLHRNYSSRNTKRLVAGFQWASYPIGCSPAAGLKPM